MHVTAWDYTRDRAVTGVGLTRIATLIEAARAEAARDGSAILLFDNGDGLQGTALDEPDNPDAVHPLMMAFEHLGYDAIGLGNHDFDAGLAPLDRALRAAPCPVLCSNLIRQRAGVLPSVAVSAVLTRDLAGATVRIGVVSALPPQTVDWNAEVLTGQVAFSDIVPAVRAEVAKLRAGACDLVVVLAHSGIGSATEEARQENAVLPLAALDGVDAVFGGHTHLPQTRHLASPAALPGYAGAQLAQIDLWLDRIGDRWRVSRSEPTLRPVAERRPDGSLAALTGVSPELSRLLSPSHEAARARMNRRVARTALPLHSYFSMVRPDRYLHLIAEAQRAAVVDALGGALPVLSAVAPGKCGGRAGPDHYTDVPAGPVLERHIQDLAVFPDRLRAVAMSGAQVLDWLDMAASVFCEVHGGQEQGGAGDAPLLNPAWPPHGFDVLFGLRYAIDLTRPARYRLNGTRTDAPLRRVRDVTCGGTPVQPEDEFIVLLNAYRANGGGHVAALSGARQVDLPPVLLRDAVRDALVRPSAPVYATDPWRFCPLSGTRVVLQTGPDARAHLADLSQFCPREAGLDEQGFLRLSLAL